MRAELRFVDHQRAGRALIGWLDGDKLALDAAMQDVVDDADASATAGLLFAMVQLSAEVLVAATGSQDAAAGYLRASLVSLTADDLDQGGEPDA